MSKMNDLVKSATKKPANKLEDKMRAAGYLPAAEVADKIGMHLGSVYRWLDEQQVKTIKSFGKRFVLQSSLVNKMGPEQARILGFLSTPAPAPK